MKRITSILLVILLVVSSMITAGAQGIKGTKSVDISGHWAEETIKKWTDQALVKGYPDGSFKPNEKMTRAEFIAIVNRIYGYTERAEGNYKDIREDSWYAKDVSIAKKQKYMEWHKQAVFNPDREITRQEVSAIVSTILYLEATKDLKEIEKYNDRNKIPKWSEVYLDALVKEEYLKGYPNGTIRPEGEITRAEVITLLDRAVGMLIDQKGNQGQEELRTVEGNVTINREGAVLENTVIEGDLIIAPGVQKGKINLKGITVKGKIIINGGEKDTIILEDSKVNKVIVADETEVQVKNGTEIKELKIENTAKDTEIDMEAKTEVDKIEAAGAVKVKGKGKIGTVEVKAEGVTVEPKVNKIIVDKGIDGSGVKKKASGGSSSSGGSSYQKSSEKEIKSTIVGSLSGNSVIDVPAGTKVSALKAGLTVSPKATAEILTGTGGSAVTEQTNTNVTKDMVIEVTAEDRSKKEYSVYLKTGTPPVLSSEKEIKSTTVGALSGNSVIDVPVGTKVSALKAGLTVSLKAAAEILTGTGGSAVTDQANTNVTKDMMIEVTAEDGSRKEYSIYLKTGTPPVLSSEKEIKSTAIGTLSGNSVIDVPVGTKVSSLKAGLTVSPKAAAEIFTGTGGSAVTDQANTDVTETMVIEVAAEDGSKKEYDIRLKPVTPALSSEKEIKSTAIGTLSGNSVIDVPAGTKVSSLKAGLTVSDKAAAEILTGTGGSAVTDQANTDVTKDMVIEVTAEDGSKKEYGIATVTYVDIDSIEDLRNIADNDSAGKVYRLIKDLDFDDDASYEDVNSKTDPSIANWRPIEGFDGIFDGGNHKIGNLKMNRNDTSQGLFKCIYSEAIIKDLILVDVNVKNIGYITGALAGGMKGGLIINCHVSGTITGERAVGGIVGQIEKTAAGVMGCIKGCSSSADITGSDAQIGGIAGVSAMITGTAWGSIQDCYSTGNITGTYAVGGIAGQSVRTFTLRCYSTGTISGKGEIGGIIGSAAVVHICDCYSTGTVIGDSKYIGGISGNIGSDSTVYGCYSTARVKGNEYTGGIVGSSKKSRIENCFAMNPQLDGTIVARVIGFEEGATLSDNYGNANMLVNGSKVTSGAANSIDGADITVFDKDQAPLSQWDFTGDGGDFFHWVMDKDMDRPVLYVIDGNGGFEQIGSDDGRIALKLLALSPENDAADVDAGISELKLVFNKKMTKEPGKTITVCDAVYESVYSSPYEAAKITIGVSDGIVIDNNEIVIPIPSGLLKPDGEYYIHIDNEAFADERKNYFEGITSKTGWRFKVK